MAQWSEDITAITQKECEVLLLFYFILLFLFFLQQELYQEGHFISSQTRCSNQYHMHSQIQSRTILCVSNLYFGV